MCDTRSLHMNTLSMLMAVGVQLPIVLINRHLLLLVSFFLVCGLPSPLAVLYLCLRRSTFAFLSVTYLLWLLQSVAWKPTSTSFFRPNESAFSVQFLFYLFVATVVPLFYWPIKSHTYTHFLYKTEDSRKVFPSIKRFFSSTAHCGHFIILLLLQLTFCRAAQNKQIVQKWSRLLSFVPVALVLICQMSRSLLQRHRQ